MHSRIKDLKAPIVVITVAIGFTFFATDSQLGNKDLLEVRPEAGTSPAPFPALNERANLPETSALKSTKLGGSSHSEEPKAATIPPSQGFETAHSAGLEVVSGEVMVKMTSGLDRQAAESLARRHNTQLLSYSPHSNLARIQVPAQQSIQQFAGNITSSPLVEQASANHIVRATNCDSSAGTHDDVEWNLDRIAADDLCSAGMPQNLSDVRVAVLDTGIAFEDTIHNGVQYKQAPGLAGTTFDAVPGSDLLAQDDSPHDDHQHGTHITSIISSQASLNGVAPNLTVLPFKVLDANAVGTEAALIEALNLAADEGVDIINMSLSFEEGYRPSWAMQEAIVAAVRSGALLIASSGNSGEAGVSFPGAFPDVVAVGATRLDRDGLCSSDPTYSDIPASYSSYGYAIDVSAPGGSVMHNRNCDAFWDAIYAETIVPSDPTDFQFYGISGTSQAAAHVSGTAAWIMAEHPELSASDVRRLIQGSAQDYDPSGNGFDPVTGAGLIDALQATTDSDLPLNAAPEIFVNILPVIYGADDEHVRGFSTVQVLTKGPAGQLQPLSNVRVMGKWSGAVKQQVEGYTDANGNVEFFSETVASEIGDLLGPLNFAFEVQAVSENAGPLAAAIRPLGFYHLSEGMSEVLEQLLADVDFEDETYSTSTSAVLFVADPEDTHLAGTFDLSKLQTSYIYKTLGAAGCTSPMAVALSPAFVDQDSEALPGEQLSIYLDQAEDFGWGSSDELQASHLSANPARMPSVDGITFLPLDPAFIQPASYTTEVLNAYWDVYEGELSAFNETFAQSTLATGYASTIFGTGYASTIFGTVVENDILLEDDQAKSLLGSGGEDNWGEASGEELGSCAYDECAAPAE